MSSAPLQGEIRHLGSFMDAQSAAIGYDKEAIRLYGPEAILNFPSGYGRKRFLTSMQNHPHMVPVGERSGQEQAATNESFPAGTAGLPYPGTRGAVERDWQVILVIW